MLGIEKLFGLKINSGRFEEFANQIITLSSPGQSAIVCVANVHMFMEAQKDKELSNIINQADLVTPDGLPLCWALKLINGLDQERVAGMDLLPVLLEKAIINKIPVYFYGGTEEMINLAKIQFAEKYPELKVAGYYSPPFRELTKIEKEEIAAKINLSGAGLVFVILGCPKQEKWMVNMKGKIHAVMIGIGGAFPVLLGIQKRAPIWVQKSGLEWLFRLCQEPIRLVRRYMTTNTRFIIMLTKEYLKLGPGRKNNPNPEC
jgi:N-acetylglucosaminyldiphosphoundecaprenol N-acetyl-beta-D-mannosaminyltransferase